MSELTQKALASAPKQHSAEGSIVLVSQQTNACYLLSLPLELRILIYEQVLVFADAILRGPHSAPWSQEGALLFQNLPTGSKKEVQSRRKSCPCKRPKKVTGNLATNVVDIALLATNSQIHAEALPVFYACNTFHYRSCNRHQTIQKTHLNETAPKMSLPPRLGQMGMMRQISFEYHLREGCHFDNYKENLETIAPSIARFLRHIDALCPALETLALHIAIDRDETWPWSGPWYPVLKNQDGLVESLKKLLTRLRELHIVTIGSVWTLQDLRDAVASRDAWSCVSQIVVDRSGRACALWPLGGRSRVVRPNNTYVLQMPQMTLRLAVVEEGSDQLRMYVVKDGHRGNLVRCFMMKGGGKGTVDT